MRKWSCARFRPSTLLSLFTAARRPGHIVRYRDLLSSAGLLRAAFAFALCLVTANSFAQSAALPEAKTKAVSIASPITLSDEVHTGDTYMGVRMLGALKLSAEKFNGHLIGGLSALGWDNDEQLLYAVSDRGYLFHLRVVFDSDGFLRDLQAVAAHALQDARGKALRGRMSDSEGLVVRNGNNGQRADTQLAISFERRPRVIRFDTYGKMIGAEALPARLRDVSQYRQGNRSLESIAWHPRWHYLVSVEQPMRGSSESIVPIHALSSGQHWRYPLAPEPNAGLTAIEVLDDGSLLTLERGFGVFFVPVLSTLRRIERLPEQDGALLEPQTVARFSSGQGWLLDNFEGLTSLDNNRVLIVSDDNTKSLQSTLLVALQLLKPQRSQ